YDLVSMVAHDLDNEEGLEVVNDLGDRWRTYGDSNLDVATARMAQLAVRLGNDDVRHAYELGRGNLGPLAADWVLGQVRGEASSPAVPGVKYAPEQILPRLDPEADNGVQNWQADSLDELWAMPIRSDMPDKTYGTEITNSVTGGEIADKLEGMAAQFPESEGDFGMTVHPQAAFQNGFLTPLQANPLIGLRSIIDFNPSEGQAGFNEDDAVMEETEGMGEERSQEYLEGLTLN
ncbi:MAG: hypothetical protein GY778_15450, partial [bacterium]|nr:hypothetical protein [bacterium]